MSKIFSFNTPPEYNKMIRDIVYNRVKNQNFFDSSVQDNEDKVSVLCEIVRRSMEESYKIGYTLGVEYGKTFK